MKKNVASVQSDQSDLSVQIAQSDQSDHTEVNNSRGKHFCEVKNHLRSKARSLFVSLSL